MKICFNDFVVFMPIDYDYGFGQHDKGNKQHPNISGNDAFSKISSTA